MMRCALLRTALSAAGKLWDDTNFAYMKMDEYCKDLEEKVGDVDKPMIPTRVIRLWKERKGGTQTTGGEGTHSVACAYGEEICWLEVG
jgi:hypothetical protein